MPQRLLEASFEASALLRHLTMRGGGKAFAPVTAASLARANKP